MKPASPADETRYVSTSMDPVAVHAILSAANLAHVVKMQLCDSGTLIICPSQRIANRVEGYLHPPMPLF